MMISVSDREENIIGKAENAGLPAFSPFPTLFSKAFFSRAVKTMDCLGKGLPAFTPFPTLFSEAFFSRAVKTRDCSGKG